LLQWLILPDLTLLALDEAVELCPIVENANGRVV